MIATVRATPAYALGQVRTRPSDRLSAAGWLPCFRGAATSPVLKLKAIRLILVSLSPLLGDMVAEVLAERWPIERLARLDDTRELPTRAAATGADLVLCRLDSDSDRLADALLAMQPSVTIVALGAGGRTARLYRAGHRLSLPRGFSPRDLIASLLATAGGTWP